MTQIEKLLRRAAPIEPSADYYAKGMALLERATSRGPRGADLWRFATVALAILLVVSAGLNVTLWRRFEASSRDYAEDTPQLYMVSSVLTMDGEYLRRETSYAPAGTEENVDEQ